MHAIANNERGHAIEGEWEGYMRELGGRKRREKHYN